MNNAILLTKLSKMDDLSFELYTYYIDATSKSFLDEITEFNTCINDLKKLTECQYDFAWLSKNASKFEVNRRDFKSLCDDVCMLLGNRIEELCKHNKTPIVTKPTKYEDYCPFASEELVAYGRIPYSHGNNNIIFDGNSYNIIDTKLEISPYYTIYCNLIER